MPGLFMRPRVDVPSVGEEMDYVASCRDGYEKCGDEILLYEMKIMAARSAYEIVRGAALQALCEVIEKQLAELKVLRRKQ